MTLSKHLNLLMVSAVSFSLAVSPVGVLPSYAQNAPAAEAPADAGWQKEFQFWRSVSKAGKVSDYESYLKAFPNGKFASVARQRLDGLKGLANTDSAPADEAQPVENAAETAADAKPVQAADAETEKKRDLEMWRQVSKTGTQADYEKYLKAFPKGKFAKIAKTRIEGLIAAAKAPAEDSVAVGDNAAQDLAQNDQPEDAVVPARQDQAQTQQVEEAPADDAAEQGQAVAPADDTQQPAQAEAPANDWEQEYALWKAASDGNTVTEYEAYLKAYPQGKFAAIAQARIIQLAAAEQPAGNIAEGDEQPLDQQANTADQSQDQNQMQAQDQQPADDQSRMSQQDDPSNQMDQANQAGPNEGQYDDQSQMAANQPADQNQNEMGQNAQPRENIQFTEGTPETEDEWLNREGRREMQGRLTSLGYDTFGTDGSFGPNSRTAITNWQQDNGAPASGYLSADQISQIRKMSQVVYAEWLNAQPRVVEEPVVVRPRREKVIVVEERNPAVDAAIAAGVIGAVVGAHKIGRFKVGRVRPGRVKVIGKFNFGKVKKVNCRKKRRC